ncbi:putative disease resistance protein RGA4 [Beta vulgaris subsp. vulgaris]|uniref:putative disease resistance protein RGA4 n=1 Tax=Beta vulgaris subsp. vulgaris TaxID=3555 RepID=UPI002036C477|nr:putative disease resistance protein RGA4 [Beta vulgaris subsp. vulgaris]
MTSQDKKVLANINTYGDDIQKATYELEGLDEDDSWSLFKRTVGNGNLTVREFQELGRRMIKKCGGVPLAIRALGDLLRNKSVEKWDEVEKHPVWHKEDGILPSLELSFNYLPNVALKKCFSYCAIFFKEDEVIQKDKLIQMWMAQGFLQPYDNMEVVGEDFVDILLNSSLFQKANFDQLGNVITFKIHELVSSLAHIASGEECSNLENILNFQDSLTTEVRHLSTTLLPGKDHPYLTSSFCGKLRTYYYCYPQVKHLQDCESSELFLKYARCLRVLCLHHLDLQNLPTSIGDLKHLRYLDISQNCFETLPDVIINLYHLQTLRIDYNTKRELRCFLPQSKVCNLVSLRHISAEFVDIGILQGMGHLTSLRTLSTINLKSKWGGKASDLGSLNNLRGILAISGLDAITDKEEARGIHLGRKSNVDKLILKWSMNLDEHSRANGILQGLEPHDKLATLEVAHYNGSSFPQWLMVDTQGSQRHCNLVSLTLQHCLYAEGDLKLENLTGLRFLLLECCDKLTISFPEHGFQCCKLLESLKLISCNKVGNLPNLSPLT